MKDCSQLDYIAVLLEAVTNVTLCLRENHLFDILILSFSVDFIQ